MDRDAVRQVIAVYGQATRVISELAGGPFGTEFRHHDTVKEQMRRSVTKRASVLEDDDLAQGHQPARGGAVEVEHADHRIEEEPQVAEREAGVLGQ